jgi:hypothetical protein
MNGQYTEQLQRLVCLLFVLGEIPSLPARKQEVIEYIRQRRYLDIRPEDLESYVTQIEPRWNTDIAFRRKDGVEWGLLFNNQRDSWELTRDGVEILEKVKKDCIAKKYDVRECYLWTKQLKKALDPSYEPSSADKSRPHKFRMPRENIFKDLV